MTFSTDEAQQPPAEGQPAEGEPAEGQPAEPAPGGDVLGELAAQQQQTAAPEERRAPRRALREEVVAVQQIYALRKGRVEIAPSFGISMNDPFVSHPALALALNYYVTEVLAIGANILWFDYGPAGNLTTDTNFQVGRSFRLVIPITEYQIAASLNFSYVPLYGKFALFREFIVHWDAYVLGGVGAFRTRPVPVVDPDNRSFDWGLRISVVNPGIGFRVYSSRFASIFIELRDYIFLEKFESLEINGDDPRDPDTWLADGSTLVNNVMFNAGLTIFFPFTFDYRLPK
ncbi:MAG: outer membrane beta-barrel domain-containing protein [Deltaproteobacteria bacterium]|nr:outer membrane beta-barrel domain-containing protein [Deltaproteobacteria bacterium]